MDAVWGAILGGEYWVWCLVSNGVCCLVSNGVCCLVSNGVWCLVMVLMNELLGGR